MAKIVTDKYGVSKSTAVPKTKTTAKSNISGVSVGEIKGSQKPAPTIAAPAPAATTPKNSNKPVYQSVNGKVVDVSKTQAPALPNTTDPNAKGYTFTEGSAEDPANLNLPKNDPSRLESYVTDTNKEAQDLVQGEYYKKYETAEELVKKGILKENPYPKTYDEYLTQTKGQNQKDTDYLEQQNAFASKADKQGLERMKSQSESAISGVKATMAQGREGVVGTSKPLAAEGFKNTTNQLVGEAQDRVQAAEMQRTQAEEGLKQAQARGDMELAAVYSGQIASAEEQIRQSKVAVMEAEQNATNSSLDIIDKLAANSSWIANLSEEDRNALGAQFKDLPQGVLDAISASGATANAAESDKAALDAKISSIDSLGKIFDKGSKMTMDQVVGLGSSLGLSMDDTLGLYQAYEANRNDKTLTEEEIAIKNASSIEDLKQKQRGEFTQASQNMAYLTKMIQDGRNPEDIAAFKSAAGITDQNDPMYQADLNYKRAQLDYTESQTAENYAALKKAEREYLDMQPGSGGGGASGGYYVPTKSLEGITSQWKDGKLQINSKTPYQCGAFVNRFWGLSSGTTSNGGMPSSLADKKAACSKNGVLKDAVNVDNFTQMVKPGMAFVTTYAGTGHTGIVTAVYPDGTYDTMEANIGDSNPNTPDPARPGHRSVKDGNLVGFARPPEGRAVLNETRSDSYSAFVQKKMDEGMSKKDAQDLANKREEENLKESTKAKEPVSDPVSIAQDIMAPGSNFNLADIKQEDRPAVAAELNKLKKEALATGDIYGAIKASAGGKDLGETARNKLDQVTFGWDQFQDLEKEVDGMFSGPITGAIRNANVWDDKKAILTARLKAIVPSLARGVYNEVGVLTEADIDNYMQTLPNTYTLESVKSDLINLTKSNIKNSLVNQLRNAAAGGADVSGYDYILDDLGIESTAKKQQKWDMVKDFAHSLVGDTQQNNGKLMIPEDITGGTFDENYIDNTF